MPTQQESGTGPESDPDAPDTDPLRVQNPFGASWGAGGWGASYAGVPDPGAAGQPAEPERKEFPAPRSGPGSYLSDRVDPPAATEGAERWQTPTPATPSVDRFEPPGWATDRPVLGDVELPAPPEPFAFPGAQPSRGPGGGGRIALLGVGALAALAAIGGVVFWLMNRSPSEPDTAVAGGTTVTATTTRQKPAAPARDARAEGQLLRLIPAGYPPGACRPVDPDPGAVAVVDCDANIDPGGPTSATFALARDRAALGAALDAAVRPADVVVCPGNIQSPGPWRRNANPQQEAGTLVCGMAGGVPTVAWSDNERMVVSVVRAEPPGPTLDQLYQWWSSHS